MNQPTNLAKALATSLRAGHAKCDTVGCTRRATEEITYYYRGGDESDTDLVCTPCAEDYSRPPVRVGFTRKPLSEEERDG